MERMDGARRIGGVLWVAGGLVFEICWWSSGRVTLGPVTTALVLLVALTTASAVWRPHARLTRWAGRATAVALGLDFVGAVADRFGALGRPGSSGVSWGDWSHFVTYTGTLLHDPGRGVATTAAIAATGVEMLLALWLVSGRQHRYAGKATAGLLVVYLVSMASSTGWAEVAKYAVPVLIGGALSASAIPRSAGDVLAVEAGPGRQQEHHDVAEGDEHSGPDGAVVGRIAHQVGERRPPVHQQPRV